MGNKYMDFYEKILKIAIFIGLISIVFIILFISNTIDTNVWNNGYHKKCGGKWEYEQAVGHYGTTSYIYICDKCGKRHEFDEIR